MNFFSHRVLQVAQRVPAVAMLMAFAWQPTQAQTPADRDLVKTARGHYLLGPIPAGISCDVVLDWDAFFATMKIEQTDAVKARVDRLKKMQIGVFSKSAAQTEVTVSDTDADSAKMVDGLRQQLKGFFQIYWSIAYGRVFPADKDPFVLTSAADGYQLDMKSGTTATTVHMDPSFAITRFAVQSPQMNADITSEFKPGDDQLLRMSQVREAINVGSGTRMELQVDVDYQPVGKVEVPQHVTLAIPGAYTFHYTLTSCKADPAPSN